MKCKHLFTQSCACSGCPLQQTSWKLCLSRGPAPSRLEEVDHLGSLGYNRAFYYYLLPSRAILSWFSQMPIYMHLRTTICRLQLWRICNIAYPVTYQPVSPTFLTNWTPQNGQKAVILPPSPQTILLLTQSPLAQVSPGFSWHLDGHLGIDRVDLPKRRIPRYPGRGAAFNLV